MLEISAVPGDGGYELRIGSYVTSGVFRRKREFKPVSGWNANAPSLPPYASFLVSELAGEERLIVQADHAFLTYRNAAGLSEVEASALGLPPALPHQIDLQSMGSLASKDFGIQVKFMRQGVRASGELIGGIFREREQIYRVSGPIYDILSCVQEVNEARGEAKIACFAKLRLLLPEQGGEKIHTEQYLLQIRIAHVTAIGLNPTSDLNFDPIPLRRIDATDPEKGADPILSPAASEDFAKAFRRQGDVNSTYLLGPGHYVFVDPDVRRALQVVRRKQSASLEERMQFFMNPAKEIAEALNEGAGAEQPPTDSIFYETAEYSERVAGIGEWVPPQLAYMEKETNSWLPERFSVVFADKLITGTPEDLPVWIEEIVSAKAKAQPVANLASKDGKSDPIAVPADEKLLELLRRLQPEERKPKEEKSEGSEEIQQTPRRNLVLKTKANFDNEEFKRNLRPRKLEDATVPPMKSQLKSHQCDGVAWLTSCYLHGWPGVLLADDMGLGKTLQSLTFLMLLRRENRVRAGRPALVVAPTSLLENWKNEHLRHAPHEGLGEPLVAYGNELRLLRLGGSKEFLDPRLLRDCNWVLTTYETVRDYHMSFAQVEFSVAVLDEVQKAKNPTTRTHTTLTALNVDFVLAMTGTPVENSISDLWAIADIAAPGYFAPLKSFMEHYGKSQDPEVRKSRLEDLSKELLEKAEFGGRTVPPFALRRMKEDVAKDLPVKHQGPMRRIPMPQRQAERYAEISAATQAGKMQILRALHDFRSISLHPAEPESVLAGSLEADAYIAMSARLSELFAILQEIEKRREKVIIFVNSRSMQRVLAFLIEQKFHCPRPDYISGETQQSQRQATVDRFSAIQGFAALVLSPRAAGVGLNIVAANHVVHLDRWWNPAVEDQCTDRAYRIGATRDVHVYTVGAVHPQLGDKSYDVILDNLLTVRREVSRRVFTSSELTAADFAEALGGAAPLSARDADLSAIDAGDFRGLEEFVRDQLLANGLNASLTSRSNDGGADIVVRDELKTVTHLIQCKHTTRLDQPIDGGLATDARRVRENWRAPNALVIGVTNAKRFSPLVEQEFSRIGGRLVARDRLQSAFWLHD